MYNAPVSTVKLLYDCQGTVNLRAAFPISLSYLPVRVLLCFTTSPLQIFLSRDIQVATISYSCYGRSNSGKMLLRIVCGLEISIGNRKIVLWIEYYGVQIRATSYLVCNGKCKNTIGTFDSDEYTISTHHFTLFLHGTTYEDFLHFGSPHPPE